MGSQKALLDKKNDLVIIANKERLCQWMKGTEMKKKLAEKSSEEFTAALASKQSTLGGGGASALCGALAAALCTMTARLRAGRSTTEEQKVRLKKIVRKANLLRKRLLELTGEDALGFAPLAAAYRLPKNMPGYQNTLRNATLRACCAPIEMLECCADVASLLEEMKVLSGKLLLSDVGCGVAICRAAMEGAALMVLVNTHSLPDDAEAEQLTERVRQILDENLTRMENTTRSIREAYQT